MTADWEMIREVFEQALGLEPHERTAFLDEACRDDPGLRRQLDAMFEACGRSGVFPTSLGAVPTRLNSAARGEQTGALQIQFAVGTIVDGKYRIDAELGAGGMGAVYRATHLHLERAVALKGIRSDLLAEPSMAERFRREAVAVARLRHPHIVTVHDYGVTPDLGAYLVMELLEGHSLRDEMDKYGPFDVSTALVIAAEVCSAAGAAHRAGVIHRDLKPENIFLEIREGAVAVKVVDFGLAKLEAAVKSLAVALTHEGVVLGTPVYMSPEQCRGEEADARSDIYAIGCVLYEMLTGERPFRAGNVWGLIYQHINDAPKPPSKLAPGLAPEIDEAILKALAKDPAERHQTAEEFADALGASGDAGVSTRLLTVTVGGVTVAHTKAPSASTKGAGSRKPPPNNLPHAVTRFVGRERQIGEVREWLAKARLVTLVGPGGIGKTRLAIETATRVLDEFEDGVWLVELAPLADPSQIIPAVGSALGAREQGGRSELESIEAWLRDKRVLLVLDNCEHLVDACARLTERLLGTSAGLCVLATSRESLAIAGEAAWQVPALALSADHSGPAPESEAVRLFADRASLAKPGFELSAAAAPIVAELCRRLEGIPLAIELAAARVKALTVEQILERLDNRFRLLAGGSRTAPSRQQTLRATLDWSYELLTEEERALLRRLSAFAGGWTLDAAEAVSDEPEVLDLLSRLVDKSVLFAHEQGHSVRYGMLETVREYAVERMTESGEADAAARRHAGYFLTLAEAAEPKLVRPEAAVWLARLDAEQDNLQAALGWLLEHDVDGYARLAAALANFWFLHGHYTEGRRWLDAAIDRSRNSPAVVLARVLVGAGMLARQQGEPAAARAYFEEGLRASREANDMQRIAWSSLNLGIMVMTLGDLSAARTYAEETLASATTLGLDHVIASSYMLLGEVSRLEEDWAAARPFYEQALAVNRRIGHQEGVSVTLNNLGATLCQQGDVEGARGCYREALTIAQRLGTKDDIACALDGLGAAAARRGEWARAGRLAGAADALRQEIGSEIEPADRSMRDRYLKDARAHLGEAALEAALAEGRASPRDRAIEDALSP